MTALPVVPRAMARADMDEAITHLIAEACVDTALNFIAEIETAFAMLGEFPAAGSPRWAHELSLPGLRSWRFGNFPWLICYVAHDDRVDVWRVLHAKRDMPAWLASDE